MYTEYRREQYRIHGDLEHRSVCGTAVVATATALRPVRRPADLDTDIERAREKERGREERDTEGGGVGGRPCARARVRNTGATGETPGTTRTLHDPPRRTALRRAADIPERWRTKIKRERVRGRKREREVHPRNDARATVGISPAFETGFLRGAGRPDHTLHLCLGLPGRREVEQEGMGVEYRSSDPESRKRVRDR